jgi:hypothetical protein
MGRKYPLSGPAFSTRTGGKGLESRPKAARGVLLGPFSDAAQARSGRGPARRQAARRRIESAVRRNSVTRACGGFGAQAGSETAGALPAISGCGVHS